MLNDLPFASVRLTSPPRFFYWERHFHWSPPPLADFDLWCILEGRGQVHLRGADVELTPGLCFVLRPGDQPVARHNPAYPLTAFYSHFDPLDNKGQTMPAETVPLPAHGITLRDLHGFAALARQCEAAYQRGDALGVRQSHLLLQLLLAKVWEWWQSPPVVPADEAIQALVHEIERRPGKLWQVAEMARRARLSRAQFTRRFAALTGRAPMSFVIHTRLELACQLIRETSMTLTQISLELGYEDLFYFSRQFKEKFGRPPSEWRQGFKNSHR